MCLLFLKKLLGIRKREKKNPACLKVQNAPQPCLFLSEYALTEASFIKNFTCVTNNEV
jgi:hypothetical protein